MRFAFGLPMKSTIQYHEEYTVQRVKLKCCIIRGIICCTPFFLYNFLLQTMVFVIKFVQFGVPHI